MAGKNNNDDFLVFVDEPTAPNQTNTSSTWHVLLVDDEPDVHIATKLALKNLDVEGRALEFSHAYSAAEAIKLLTQENNFCVAIIDVVMETDDAGLRLVEHIRNVLNLHSLRIILRTGQPGYAPEIETIKQFDINDYKTKTELTQVRLFTSLTIAIRSYAQIQQLESNRRGLEQILEATSELGRLVGLKKFASGLVTQLCSLLNVDSECLVCAAISEPNSPPYILAAAGNYQEWIGLAVADIPQVRVKKHLEDTLHKQQHFFDDGACLFFPGNSFQGLAAYVDIYRPLEPHEKKLLEVFCGNISTAFKNLQLYLTINELAFNDSLVNLPNRNALVAALDDHIKTQNALALVDIDNFADINSILDDSFGDAVLKAVATRLRSFFPDNTLVTRIGSDLFGLLGNINEVNPESIEAAFADPFIINGTESLRISATSGLVLSAARPQASVEALKNAGAALKQAKRVQRGKALYFKESQSIAARDRINMLNKLRTSISEQHLELYYQPFIRLKDKKVIGAECLLRWKTPEGEYIAPDMFIPIAEQSGLMIPIGEWVIRTALAWRLSLQGKVDDSFRVAINVSHTQFAEPDFVNMFLSLLEESGVPGSQVEIELTESIAIENINMLSDRLQKLQKADIYLAMDDFGTGYSSLSVLQNLKLNRLKIDRSFVSGECASSNSYEMANTIIAMANHLKLKTIAEGIETEKQFDFFLAAGCQDGQGYLFSKPLPECSFIDWLEKWQFKISQE